MPLGLATINPSWQEFLARKKEEWWQLNETMGWAVHSKKKCPTCGTVFTCHDCYIEYYLCGRVTDWKNKTECECPRCLKASLGLSEGEVSKPTERKLSGIAQTVDARWANNNTSTQ